MSTVIQINNGFRIFTKGASEIVLGVCSSYLDESGNVVPLTSELRSKLSKTIDTMAELGFLKIKREKFSIPIFNIKKIYQF